MKAPNLLSVGERTMIRGYSQGWVQFKYPALINGSCASLIIFDVQALLPVWYRAMERGNDPLGQRSTTLNVF